MRPFPDETYEQWADRVDLFERGRAMQKIAQGEPVELVLEEMSRRITEKMLHPIFKALHESYTSTYDAEKNKEEYARIMHHRAPVADHIDGNLFDNT